MCSETKDVKKTIFKVNASDSVAKRIVKLFTRKKGRLAKYESILLQYQYALFFTRICLKSLCQKVLKLTHIYCLRAWSRFLSRFLFRFLSRLLSLSPSRPELFSSRANRLLCPSRSPSLPCRRPRPPVWPPRPLPRPPGPPRRLRRLTSIKAPLTLCGWWFRQLEWKSVFT